MTQTSVVIYFSSISYAVSCLHMPTNTMRNCDGFYIWSAGNRLTCNITWQHYWKLMENATV